MYMSLEQGPHWLLAPRGSRAGPSEEVQETSRGVEYVYVSLFS